MKATIVGTLTGLTAAIAMMWLGPRPPAVREAQVDPLTGQQALSGRVLPTTRSIEVGRKLARVLPSVKCEALPLAKFIRALTDSTGLNIYVEWRELTAAAAGPDSPITLNVQNVGVGTALQLALDQARLTGPRVGYVVLEGIVKVSTLPNLDRAAMVRVYDVRDLIETSVALKRRLVTGMPVPPNLSGGPSRGLDPEADAGNELQELIYKAMPGAYRTDEVERVSYFAGRLVISQTDAGHHLVEVILAGLRATPGPK